MSLPFVDNWLIYQGATFERSYRWANLVDDEKVPVDLTNWTARLQIRPKHHDPIVLATLTTENGGITLGGTLGTIDILVTPEITKTWTQQGAVFDMELYETDSVPQRVVRFCKGSVTLDFEVTLDDDE